MDHLVRNNFLSSKCTVCQRITEEICQHVLLKVIVCKACQSESKSKFDELGDYCIWCLQHEGELLPCVQCQYKCCYECIHANLGPDYMNYLNEKNWICFVCDPNPIELLQRECIQIHESQKRSSIEPLPPDGTSSSIDISSPFVSVDEGDEPSRRRKSTPPSHDLDYILNMYSKQIAASLELDDANVPAIIAEINSIQTDQLTPVIRSFKKCLSAFASDLTNLESRVMQATASGNHATLTKLTSLLRILLQHHIFNRLSHPKARIRDDVTADKPEKSLIVFPPGQTGQKMVLIMDQDWLKDPNKLKMTVEKVAIDLNHHKSSARSDLSIGDLTKIIDSYASGKKRDGNSSDTSTTTSSKKQRIFSSGGGDFDTKIDRQRRSLTTPSWLSDFKIEKENDRIVEDDEDEVEEGDDHEWTDYRVNRGHDAPRKRGRPPKNPNFMKLSFSDFSQDLTPEFPKRGRGRPKKSFTLNDKQPRYYIPKLNGDALRSIVDDKHNSS